MKRMRAVQRGWPLPVWALQAQIDKIQVTSVEVSRRATITNGHIIEVPLPAAYGGGAPGVKVQVLDSQAIDEDAFEDIWSRAMNHAGRFKASSHISAECIYALEGVLACKKE